MKPKIIVVSAILIALGAAGWKIKTNNAISEQKQAKVKVDEKSRASIASQVAELGEEAKQFSATPDQQDLVSDNLPSIPWRQVYQDLNKAEATGILRIAQNMVTHALKDPDSAKFKDAKIMAIVDSRGHRYFICGLVNAKNSYGGYTGFKQYIFEVDSKQPTSMKGGIGGEGSIASVRFDDRWWKYDADDACISDGTPVE